MSTFDHTATILNGPTVPIERLSRAMARYSPKTPPALRERIVTSYTVLGTLAGTGNFLPLVQGAHETNWFTSPRFVLAWNPAGLGSTNDGAWGETFETPEAGILAQLAHLLAYAIPAGAGTYLQRQLITLDPRLDAVTKKGWRGAADRWVELGAKWATGEEYGERVLKRAHVVWTNIP